MVIDLVRQALLAHPHIQLAILFGSQAAGSARPDSDVDVAVMADRPLEASQKMALIQELAEATGRAIDLIDLRTAGEPITGQVLTHGQRIVGSDEAHAELLRRHLFDAADFLPYVQRMLRERRQSWIGS